MDKKYCRHCLPTKRTSHFGLHLEYYLDKFAIFDVSFSRPEWFIFFLMLLEKIGWVKFIEEPERRSIQNRSFIFFEEAKKRNLKIFAVQFFSKYINGFLLEHEEKKYYYERTPLDLLEKNEKNIDDKIKLKKALLKASCPVAPGKKFVNIKKAFDYGKELGFPVIVKPVDGSLSHHVTTNIMKDEDLLTALKVAKEYKPAFMVEKHVYGKLYRATIVGQEKVYVCKKELANVIGDGELNVEELIDQKNIVENRKINNRTLSKINIDDKLIQRLKKNNIDLKDILRKGDQVCLSDKFVLSDGCDVVNVKKEVNNENLSLFLNVGKRLNKQLVGLDFISVDISKSWKEDESAILEANSFPYLDMHQFPSHGEAENVASDVWDIVLKKISGK